MNGGTESGGPLAHRTTRGTRGAVRNVQVATQACTAQCALQTATATPHQLQLLVVPCCGSWLLAPAAARRGPFSSGTRSDRREESIIRPTIISFVIHKAFLLLVNTEVKVKIRWIA